MSVSVDMTSNSAQTSDEQKKPGAEADEDRKSGLWGWGTQVYQRLSGQEDPDKMSQEEYEKYINQLYTARRDVKMKWHNAHKECEDEITKLLECNKKLYELEGTGQAVEDQNISESEKKELLAHSKKKKKDMMAEIRHHQLLYEEKKAALEMQDDNFRLFQKDQGRVIGTVEKHQVYDLKKKRKTKRNSAHIAILSALNTSPVMEKFNQAEREEHIAEVTKLLRELEQVEEDTDELVERLKLKVNSIEATEASQSAEIERTLNRETEMDSSLENLNNTISTNNEMLKSTTHQFKDDIAANINGVLSMKTKSICACILVSLVLIMVAAGIIISLKSSGVIT